jgi:enoyl-CoA hydratase/carnithine racemase
MLDAITESVRARDDDAKAILLRGEGAIFCAGFDLTLCRDDPDAMSALLRSLSTTIRALRACPLPVVACAHAGAIAGGCALLSGCDLVFTNADARLGYPVLRIGVSPAVTTPLLTLSLGHAAARERAMDPSLVDGRDAARLGLADRCLDTPEQAAAHTRDAAFTLAAKPRVGVEATKKWLNTLEGDDLDDMLDAALETSLSLAGGEEERLLLASIWKS